MRKALLGIAAVATAAIGLAGCAGYRALHPPGVPYRNVKPAYCPYGDCAAGTWVQQQQAKQQKQSQGK